MGTETYIVCDQCKVMRDLDKFYLTVHNCENRKHALDAQIWVKDKYSFAAGLLATFMGKHLGHSCRMVVDNTAYDLKENQGYAEDYDFWSVDQ